MYIYFTGNHFNVVSEFKLYKQSIAMYEICHMLSIPHMLIGRGADELANYANGNAKHF